MPAYNEHVHSKTGIYGNDNSDMCTAEHTTHRHHHQPSAPPGISEKFRSRFLPATQMFERNEDSK